MINILEKIQKYKEAQKFRKKKGFKKIGIKEFEKKLIK
jgi:hypothetical protein